MSVPRPPTKGPKFEELMDQVDSNLIRKGVTIPSRPILAMMEISKRFNITLPGGGYPEFIASHKPENQDLTDAILQWYTDNYGKRLNEGSTPLKTVVLLDGDLYTLCVPQFIGSVTFVVTREWLPDLRISRGPSICNVMQLIDGMTSAKAARLSETALRTIWPTFEQATLAAYTLIATNNELMSIARGDVQVAVSHLIGVEQRFGDSRWASLHASEKVLKAAIELADSKFSHTHNLAELCQQLADAGVQVEADSQVALLQCGPSIRYGKHKTTRDEALAAHHASLELVNIVREAGAKFSLGISDLSN